MSHFNAHLRVLPILVICVFAAAGFGAVRLKADATSVSSAEGDLRLKANATSVSLAQGDLRLSADATSVSRAGEREALEAPQASRVDAEALHRPFDQILDLYVRDGLVYYRALQLERQRFDRYVAALSIPADAYATWSPEERAAYWINAYNAFVLRTVIDHYPVRGGSDQYPTNSIRQIPGAFERRTHRAAGRTVSLDEIEKVILPEFDDPRMLLVLGRGAVGSPRLRSEALTAGSLAAQLADATREFVRDPKHIRIDRLGQVVSVSPIVGWQEQEFMKVFGTDTARYPRRTPIERAILVLMEPHLLPTEREFIASDRFKISYHPLDWRLNDLTGGPPR